VSTEATIKTLDHAWKTLEPLQVPMAVMGGLALAKWKSIRATRYVDLLVDPGDTPIDNLIQQLQGAGFRAKRSDPVIRLTDAEFIQLWYEPPETLIDVQVDFMLARTPFQKEAVARRVRIPDKGLGFETAVVSCENLILLKLCAGRLIDRADAVDLLRANRNSLDVDYLLQWAERLDLSRDVADVWAEALPDEKFPIETN
jgi:hypothetical protein